MSGTQANQPPASQPGAPPPPTNVPTGAAPPSPTEAANAPASRAKPAPESVDPIRELLDRMDQLRPLISGVDPTLARTMERLSQRGADAERLAQPGFRTNVAYALQDLEKFHVGRLDLPAPVRSELTALAGTAVGLTNERMQSLMQATSAINDRSLIREIRDLGSRTASLADQNHPQVESRIDVLENRVRLIARPAEPAPTDLSSNPNPGTTPPSRPPNNNGPNRGPDGEPNNQFHPGQGGVGVQGRQNQEQVPVQHSVLDTLLRAMRPDGKQPQAPWEPPATPMADRHAALAQRTQIEQDDRVLTGLQKRGVAALDALQGFANGEGAAVMGRIEAAAKTEPGGMAQVLSEMREGGRFADLRKQFGNALADDKGFAAAYDRAANSLAAYGASRTTAEAVLSRRPDATGFMQRLEQMDADIGMAAASTPSKTEGKSMIEDIAKKAAELLHKAVDAVRNAFSRSPTPGANPSNSPNP